MSKVFGLVLGVVLVLSPSIFAENGARKDNSPRNFQQSNDWIFVGCRPSPGECRDSCATHRYKAVGASPLCRKDDPMESVACYCGT